MLFRKEEKRIKDAAAKEEKETAEALKLIGNLSSLSTFFGFLPCSLHHLSAADNAKHSKDVGIPAVQALVKSRVDLYSR